MKPMAIIGMLALASPAAAQSGIPSAVADGMYMTVAEVRSNSIDMFEHFAGPNGGPISKQAFVSTNVPDGALEKPEAQVLERLFGLLDANGNGQVTLSEWRSALDRDLQFADQNSDGRVTFKELANARQNMSFGDAVGMVF